MFFPVTFGGDCSFDTTVITAIPTAPVVAVLDHFLYIISSSGDTLTIYDISVPASPVLQSTTSLGAGKTPHDIKVVGNYAYITYGATGELAIWDISNKASPSLSGSVSVGASANPFGVSILGNNAFVALYTYSLSQNIKKIDITNPAAPTVTGTWIYSGANGSRNSECIALGSYLYTAGNYNSASGNNYMAVINPSTMTTVGAATWSSGGGDVEAGGIAINSVGPYVYVSRALVKLLSVVDATNPAAPSIVGSVTYSTGSVSGENPVGYKNGTAYIGKSSGTDLKVFKIDVTTPSVPVVSGNISSGNAGVADLIIVDDLCTTLAFSTWDGGAKVYLKGSA